MRAARLRMRSDQRSQIMNDFLQSVCLSREFFRSCCAFLCRGGRRLRHLPDLAYGLGDLFNAARLFLTGRIHFFNQHANLFRSLGDGANGNHDLIYLLLSALRTD